MEEQAEKVSAIQFHITHNVVIDSFLGFRFTRETLDEVLSQSKELKNLDKDKNEFDSEDDFVDYYLELILDFLNDWVEDDLQSILDEKLTVVINEIEEQYNVSESRVIQNEHTFSKEIPFIREYLSDVYNNAWARQQNTSFDAEVFRSDHVRIETVVEDKECFDHSSADKLMRAKVDQPLEELEEIVDVDDNRETTINYLINVKDVEGEIDDLERFFETFIY